MDSPPAKIHGTSYIVSKSLAATAPQPPQDPRRPLNSELRPLDGRESRIQRPPDLPHRPRSWLRRALTFASAQPPRTCNPSDAEGGEGDEAATATDVGWPGLAGYHRCRWYETEGGRRSTDGERNGKGRSVILVLANVDTT